MAESQPKRICTYTDLQIPIGNEVYVSDENENDSGSDISTSSDSSYSANDDDPTDEGISSEGSLVSLMDDGPCDLRSKDGTKWWNTEPKENSHLEYVQLQHEPQLASSSLDSHFYQGNVKHI